VNEKPLFTIQGLTPIFQELYKDGLQSGAIVTVEPGWVRIRPPDEGS